MKLLKSRLSLVQELLKEKTAWSGKLFKLYQHLPSYGIWIDSLNIQHQRVAQSPSSGATQAGSGTISVSIVGIAVSIDTITQFIANLEESETFSNVVLNSIAGGSTSPAGGSFISFNLAVQIQARGGG